MIQRIKIKTKPSHSLLLMCIVLIIGIVLAGPTIALAADLPTGSIIINNGEGCTTSSTVNLSLTSSDTNGQMMISNNSDFSGASWEPFSSTKSWTLTSGDGMKFVFVKFKNTNGDISVVDINDSIGVDNVAPNAYVGIHDNGANLTTSSNVIVGVAGDAGYPLSPIAYTMISNNPDFSGASWVPYTFGDGGDGWCFHNTMSWTLLPGSGTRTVYYKVKDTLGHESAVASDSVYVDLAAGTISINNGDSYTTSNTVNLSLTMVDTNGQMMISNNSDFSGASWEPFSSTKSWTLTSGDGVKTVYAKFKDSNGSVSVNVVNDSIGVDNVAPNAYVSVFTDNGYTTSSNVTLRIAGDAGYPLSPIAYMMISNNADFSGASWEPYSNGYWGDGWCFHDYRAWTLTSGSGTRTVYYKLKDTLGHESAVASGSVYVDLATGTVSINNGDSYTTSNTVTLSLTAADPNGQMMISNNSDFSGASWESFSSTKSWNLTSGDGVKTVYAKFKNSNNEVSLNTVNDSIGVDNVAPNAYVTINGGDYTTSSNVTLHIAGDATYPFSPIAYMMISNNPDFSGASWEPYSYLLYSGFDPWWFHDYGKTWTLLPGSGTRTVYYKLKDTLGNVSAVASDSIIVQ